MLFKFSEILLKFSKLFPLPRFTYFDRRLLAAPYGGTLGHRHQETVWCLPERLESTFDGCRARFTLERLKADRMDLRSGGRDFHITWSLIQRI